MYEINNSAFDYASHFPNCPKAPFFSPDSVGVIIDVAVENWLLHKEKTTAHSTWTNYRSKSKHILAKFIGRNIRSIKSTEIRNWASSELHHLANKTINDIWTVMRGTFDDYGLDNDNFNNPFDHIKNRTVLREEPDPFNQAEIDQILNCGTHKQQEVNLVEFAIYTGLSSSELIALAWEDVNLEQRTIKLKHAKVKGRWKCTKNTTRARTVELLDQAVDVLERQLQHSYMKGQIEINALQADNKTFRTANITPVFLSTNTGRQYYSDKTLRESFFIAHLKKAKVRYRGPNHCRHTFASKMLTIGMPKQWVAKQMGHTSTTMIDKHYERWISEDAPFMAQMASDRLKMPHSRPNEKENAAKRFKIRDKIGGEGGIRTLGEITPTLPFQGSSFGHSDTSPLRRLESLTAIKSP